jgi:hypothetical protein
MIKNLSLILLIFLLSVASVFAKSERLTKEEFLSRIENGSITLEKAPIMSVPANFQKHMLDKIKEKYPNFKDQMWYFAYIKDNNFMYSLFFDWTSDSCVLRIEELDKKTGRQTVNSVDIHGQKVKKSYCDKGFGTKF